MPVFAKLAFNNAHELDWWISLPASRNTHAGVLFGKCIQLALVRALMDEGVVFSVKTDDSALALVLRASKCTVVHAHAGSKWPRFLHNVASSLFHALAARLAAVLTRSGARHPPADAGVLEIFIQRDSFGSGGFQDRYYPGFYECLDAGERRRLFYLPIFHRIRDYLGLFRLLRGAPQNFLLREDYLTWRDYLFAFGHWRRARRLKGMRATFAGFEIGALLDAEIEAGRYSNATIQALLTYRFWSCHAPAGCPVLVDWYEGHGIDHATAAAIRWQGSKTRLVAMRPIAPESYLGLTPTAGEVGAQVVPQDWAVVGAASRRRLAEKIPELRIVPAPGLRHRALQNIKRRLPPDGPWTVLIVLSIEARMVLQVAHLLEKLKGLDCHWRIKRHPGMPRAEAERLLAEVKGDLQFVEGVFAELLSEVDTVAGLGTNTLIEAAAAGVPVICLSAGNMPAESPFTPDAPVFCRVVYDADSFSRALSEARAASCGEGIPVELNDLLGPFGPVVLKRVLFDGNSHT